MWNQGNDNIVLGLETMRHLMETLGNVQNKLQIIHVAGTNGKGSVCAMISEIIKRAGYKVGMYTSPWVFEYEEIWKINGESIGELPFLECSENVNAACTQLIEQGYPHPTAFEMETALAFLWFAREECDLVVLETGLGGLEDATNIIEKSVCSVITSISMDHMGFLGSTLGEIAKAKAGIIKEGRPVVVLKPEADQVSEVLEKACRESHSPLFWADLSTAENIHRKNEFTVFDWKDYKNIHLSLEGLYQVENALCVLNAIQVLNIQGFSITKEAVLEGLANTSWLGRFEVINRSPLIVLDGAHNVGAAKKLRETLENSFLERTDVPNMRIKKIIFIVGFLADKDYHGILEILLPLAWKVYTVTPNNPRALEGEILSQEIRGAKYFPDIKEALFVAMDEVERESSGQGKDTMILVCGSLSYLKEVKDAYREQRI